MRMTLPKTMRVFKLVAENAQCIALTSGQRAKGETVEIGQIVAKRWDDRERLVIPLEGRNAGQFLLVHDLDERAQELAVDWMIEQGHAMHVTNPLAKAEKWKEANKIREHAQVYLQAFAPQHLRRVS